MKILVVDDSEIALMATRAALESDGHQVIVRSDPIGTGAEILRERPDLVVLDVTMPLVDGQHITRMIKEDRSLWDVIVILYSDRPDEELERMAAQCGADGYLRKTPRQDRLRAAVTRWARGSAAFTTVGTMRGPPPMGPVLFLDTPTARTDYERAFAGQFDCLFASTSSAALRRMAGSAPPSAVVMELCLPEMDGEAVLERALRLHERWRTRIIFVASQPWRPEVARLARSGRVPLLEKPFDFRELGHLIELARAGDLPTR